MNEDPPHNRIAVLGSTGSIGTNCLEVVAGLGNGTQVLGLTAHTNWQRLAEQSRTFHPRWIALSDRGLQETVNLSAFAAGTELLYGDEAVERVASAKDVDVVICGIVGVAGLRGVTAAIEAGKRVGIANKEPLVMAGPLMMRAAAEHGATLIPVDSEHSAIFQAMKSGKRDEVKRIVLTASGGPFRGWSGQQLADVTPEMALAHPTWEMGAKITIDSATLMNKALEIIEAKWLFGLRDDQIEVVIHPQSIVHSFVEFIDGSVIAQLSPPDMKLPIQYALTYPLRVEGAARKLDWSVAMTLQFDPPDMDNFPGLQLGFDVARKGGTCGAVLNAANEGAVARFLDGDLRFSEIPRACRAILEAHEFDPNPNLAELLRQDGWARGDTEVAILALSMASIPNILLVALGLGFVIFIHELGHFAVAKWCNVNVERFSIGFGPVIWSRTWGETEYALSLVPFGGYVKMLGQDDMDPSQETDEDIAEDPRSYTAKSVPQRMAIISAGVTMNLLTAVLFFLFAFKLGVEFTPAIVGQAVAGDPAWEAGLRTGDELTQINGRSGNPLRFIDLKQEVALSSGDVQVKGIRRFYDDVQVTEQEFETTLTPKTGGLIPEVGVAPIMGMKLPLPEGDDDSVVSPGSAAAAASPAFAGGDEIIKVDEVDISGYADLQNVLARRRDREVTFTVRRGKEEIGIKTGPNYFHTLGLKMDIGPISNIQRDSPAAKADPPLQINDKITHIISESLGTREVGADLNALELPDYLATLHGQKITIRVKRGTSGEEQSIDCKITPDDRQGWTETPLGPTVPLVVPAIGIGYHVLPYVLKVEKGSPAEGEVNRDGKSNFIKRIEFFPPIGFEIDPIEFNNKKGKPANWAYVFWLMQKYPEKSVSLTVVEQDSDKEYTTKKLTSRPRNESGSEWYLPIRGIKLSMLVQKRKADTYGESMSLAYSRTRSSLLEIYLTLRSLFSGRVSMKALRGPLGIAETAYYFSQKGLGDLLWFLGLLSISLAVLNFLPIPVLDGGHMVFLIWEGIRGKPASERVMIGANYVGLCLVLCLMLWVLWLDIFVHWLGWGEL